MAKFQSSFRLNAIASQGGNIIGEVKDVQRKGLSRDGEKNYFSAAKIAATLHARRTKAFLDR